MKFKLIAALSIVLFVAIGLRLALVAFDIIPSSPSIEILDESQVPTAYEPIQQFELVDSITYSQLYWTEKDLGGSDNTTLYLGEEWIKLSSMADTIKGNWKHDTFYTTYDFPIISLEGREKATLSTLKNTFILSK